jgi:Transcriptional regulator, AbiEi antitoxin
MCAPSERRYHNSNNVLGNQGALVRMRNTFRDTGLPGGGRPGAVTARAVVDNIQGHYIIDMKPRRWDTTLYDLAENQSGYFTAAQARAAGLHPVRLVQLERSEDIERLSRGVYRLARYPISPFGQYMEASLWPQVRRPEMRGTISHESALAMYGLSDVSPSKVHITLPPALRIRRTPPAQLVIHYAPLDPKDVQMIEGIPVTTAERAIRDVHAAHLGPALVRQAIEDGRRTGYLSSDQATELKRELLNRKKS